MLAEKKTQNVNSHVAEVDGHDPKPWPSLLFLWPFLKNCTKALSRRRPTRSAIVASSPPDLHFSGNRRYGYLRQLMRHFPKRAQSGHSSPQKTHMSGTSARLSSPFRPYAVVRRPSEVLHLCEQKRKRTFQLRYRADRNQGDFVQGSAIKTTP